MFISRRAIYHIPDELEIAIPIHPEALEQVYMIVHEIYDEFSPREKENIELWQPKLEAIVGSRFMKAIDIATPLVRNEALQLLAALKVVAAFIIGLASERAERMGLHDVTEEFLIDIINENWFLKPLSVFVGIPLRRSVSRRTTT